MRWLTRHTWHLRHDDRGAVAALVAILLGFGLLLGIGALVVDTGQLYAERAQLQNGADAAAMGVAQSCAGAVLCGLGTNTTAGNLANANANDGTSNVDLVCGGAGGLAACPSPDTGCTSAPTQSTYAEVHTSTRRPNGSTLLPPAFAQLLLGSAYPGSTVHACARAAWGGPGTATGFALTISLCNWMSDTAGGTVFASAPGSGQTPSASVDQVLTLHATGVTGCPGGPSGWDLPGGFGWLTDPNGNCTTPISAGGSYADNSGVSASRACETALQNARSAATVLLIPVFDGSSGTGSGGLFHLRGFASFVVTGYHLPGFNAPSLLTGLPICTGSTLCVSGYFTQALIPAGSVVLGGPSMGATAIQLVS